VELDGDLLADINGLVISVIEDADEQLAVKRSIVSSIKFYGEACAAEARAEIQAELDEANEELNCAETMLDATLVGCLEDRDFKCIGEYIEAVVGAYEAKLTSTSAQVERMREALQTIMNYPDIRQYLGSLISEMADVALSATGQVE